VAEQVDRSTTDRFKKRGEIGDELVDRVAVEASRLGGMAVAALVDEDDATVRREVIRHKSEVMGRAGEAVDQDEGR
jgi:hypothetical protein